jgi:hypothetical protein
MEGNKTFICPRALRDAERRMMSSGELVEPSEVSCVGGNCPGPQFRRPEVLGIPLPFPRLLGSAVCGKEVQQSVESPTPATD